MLPALAAYAYSSILMLRGKKTKMWLLSSLIMACVLLLLYMHHCTYNTHAQPFPFATFMRAVIIMLIVPAIYAYVCRQVGIPWLNRHLTWMLIFCIPAHPYLVCLLMNPLPQYMTEQYGGNAFLFSYDGHHVMEMCPTSMVVSMQVAMAAYRTYALSQMISQRHLLLTHKMRLFLTLVFTSAVVILLCMMMPTSVWSVTPIMWLSTIIFSAIICAWYVLLPHLSQDDTNFTDENQNPVKLTSNSLTSLASGVRFLMDHEKIYTQSSLKVEQVARMLGTNRTYLSRTIRKEYDKTFPQLIMAYRIEEAKRLLKEDPEMKMNEVALRCGFKNSSVLGKAFREETGTTPLNWRRLQGEPIARNKQAQYPMHDVTPT